MPSLLRKAARARQRAAVKNATLARADKSAADQVWLARVLDAVKRFPAFGPVFQKTLATLERLDELGEVFGAARVRLEALVRVEGRPMTTPELREHMTPAELAAVDEHRRLRDELETALGISERAQGVTLKLDGVEVALPAASA
jgi:hypothetical protein